MTETTLPRRRVAQATRRHRHDASFTDAVVAAYIHDISAGPRRVLRPPRERAAAATRSR